MNNIYHVRDDKFAKYIIVSFSHQLNCALNCAVIFNSIHIIMYFCVRIELTPNLEISPFRFDIFSILELIFPKWKIPMPLGTHVITL